MKHKSRLGLLILVVLAFCFSSFGVHLDVTINETSSLTQLLNGQYSLEADGSIEIYNPSLTSKVYDFYIPLSLDALIGIDKVVLDNSSAKFEFNYDKIRGYLVEPNETIRVGYHIFGLLTYDLYNKSEFENSSVLEYYVDSFDFTSKVILNLDKPQQEGYLYDMNQTEVSAPVSNTTRAVSIGLRNPTDFSYFAQELNLYKTHPGDPMFSESKLVKTFKNQTISPFDFKQFHYKDPLSDGNDVYWMSSDVTINYDISNQLIRNFLVEQPRPSGGGGSGSSGGGSSGGGSFGSLIVPDEEDELQEYISSLLLKKTVDTNLITLGSNVTVMLQVANVNEFTLENLSLFDILPENFEVLSSTVPIEHQGNGKLSFGVFSLDPYESLTFSYTLKNKESQKGITYLKPAELFFENLSRFSDGVLLINDILPDKKLFVQKDIELLDDSFAKVTLKVKNLGGITLENVLVSDTIDDNAILKDISQLFLERGLWKINTLDPNEEWEVSYVIERTSSLDTLPNIFGVDSTQVLGTIVSSGEVITVFQDEPKLIERVGLGFAIGLLILYLLF